MEKGRILAIDPGTKRIGLAVSDALGITAQGIDSLSYEGYEKLLESLKDLISEYNIKTLLVGLPLNLDGTTGPKAREAVALSEKNKCATTLNAVVCSENIEDVPELVKFAKRLGVAGIMVDFATFHDYWTELTVEGGGTYDPKRLDWRNDVEAAQRMVRVLLGMKKKGYPVITSRSYLVAIRRNDFNFKNSRSPQLCSL